VKLKEVIPWVWTGLVFAVSLAVFLIGGYESSDLSSRVDTAGLLVMPTLFTALGSLILTRQPGNRIAWIFYFVGAGAVLESAALLLLSSDPDPPNVWHLLAAMWVSSWFFYFAIALLLLLFLFPTGRFLTRRWSWAGWLAAVTVADLSIATVFATELGPPEGDWTITNPIGFIPAPFEQDDSLFPVVLGIGLIALMLGGVVALVVRYRRSSQLVRIQIKWVVYALMVFVIVFASRLFVEQWRDNLASNLIFSLSLTLIPVSITVAIIRYRLYEIDRIISRTLAYLLVVGLLAATYFGTVTFITSRLSAPNAVAVAGSTLLVAALFNPLRKRIQTAVDRRFNRSSYQAQQVAEQFGVQLQESLTIEEITNAWIETVDQVLQPEAAAVWLQAEESPIRSPDQV
jgi:hypothetical protein